MSYKVTLASTKFQAKMAKIKALHNKTITAGFFNKNTAKIARINNYGAIIPVTEKMRWFFIFNFDYGIGKDKVNIIIPPRPFMTTAFEKNKKFYAKRLKHAFKENKNAQTAMEILGTSIAQDIHISISEGGWITNAPLTIELKGKNTPLQWTGQMQKSITYKIE